MKVEIQAYTLPVIKDVSPQDFTAYIARIGKVKEEPEKLLRYLIKHAHWSPFEHTYVTLKIRTSRAIGRELLRHRSCTFQELSQRYEAVMEFELVEVRKQSTSNRQSSTEVFEPMIELEHYFSTGVDAGTKYTETLPASEAIIVAQNFCLNLYNSLLKAGVARECARMVLPESTATTILMTGNIRSWIHFLGVRDDPRAQKEAQLVAKEARSILLEYFPVIFKALQYDNDPKSNVHQEGSTGIPN